MTFDEWRETYSNQPMMNEAMARAAWDFAVKYEREQCAKVCEEEVKQFMQCAGSMTTGSYDWKADGAEDCAEAIRARSNK